jgi:radical SAM superfamily enzyme YgiQ (UPF0313 family)
LKIALICIRDKHFVSNASSKFLKRREKNPYPGNKKHYVFGEPPLGIMYLSSVLKKAGHEVLLTDQCHPEYTDRSFLELLEKERPDIVGFSFLSNACYPIAISLSRKIKTALPASKIVYGGVFSTINAQKIVATEDSVDIVARGEGEDIIIDLTLNLSRPDNILGITFKSKSGLVVENPDRQHIRDLDTIPFPDRDSLDIHYVATLPLNFPAAIWDLPYTSVLSSRGCPFSCIFCNCPTFSKRICRFRSAGNILEELDELAVKGYRSLCFVDDNFLLDRDRVVEICNGMIARDYQFKWSCEGRTDSRLNDTFDILSTAGCDLLMFGVESGSQRILDYMRKRTGLPQIEKAISNARKAGISLIHGFFLVGTPGETVEEVKETLRFAEKIDINSFAFGTLRAFRGTALWRDAVERSLIDDDKDWDKVFFAHAIYPDVLDSKVLYKLRSRLLKKLIFKKIVKKPFDAVKMLRRFFECVSLKDIYQILTSSETGYSLRKEEKIQ